MALELLTKYQQQLKLKQLKLKQLKLKQLKLKQLKLKQLKWRQKIAQILGYFWTEVFKDSWLIEAISKSFSYVLGSSILCIVTQLKKQLAFSYLPNTLSLFPVRVLVPYLQDTDNIDISKYFAAIPLYINYGKLVNIENLKGIPYSIQNRILSPSCTLIVDTDYTYENKSIVFIKTLKLSLFELTVATIDGLIKPCYLMWFNIKSTSYVLDRLSLMLLLPMEWTWRFPSSLFQAWKIKQLGATFPRLKELFKTLENTDILFYKNITEFPVYTTEGISWVTNITKADISWATNITKADMGCMFLIFKINKKYTEEHKRAFLFVQKQLPLGTVMIAFDSSVSTEPCYTSFKNIKPFLYSVLKSERDFDPVKKYKWKE